MDTITLPQPGRTCDSPGSQIHEEENQEGYGSYEGALNASQAPQIQRDLTRDNAASSLAPPHSLNSPSTENNPNVQDGTQGHVVPPSAAPTAIAATYPVVTSSDETNAQHTLFFSIPSILQEVKRYSRPWARRCLDIWCMITFMETRKRIGNPS